MKYRIIPKNVIKNEHLLQQKEWFFWKTIYAGTIQEVLDESDRLTGKKFVKTGIGVVPPSPWPKTMYEKKRVVEEDSGPDLIDVVVTASLLNNINDNDVPTPREEAFDGFKGGESGGGGADRSFDAPDNTPSESCSDSDSSCSDSNDSCSCDSSDSCSCDCGGSD
jgi:hypothetical protein